MGKRSKPAAVCAVAALLVAVVAAGCGGEQTAAGEGDIPDALSGELHVLVAASLLGVTEELAAEFEELNPGVEVLVAGAGSSALREQVLAGAPADVFIPADAAHLEPVREQVGLAGPPVVVARNSLVLAVPVANDAGVRTLADLARPELLIGLCAAEVPCGALARSGLAELGIEPVPDTDEPNVRALATKLAAGELDAAVTYATDAADRPTRGELEQGQDSGSMSAIVSLGWPADPGTASAPRASYAAAVLADSPQEPVARDFLEFLLSEAGQQSFARYGFGSP